MLAVLFVDAYAFIVVYFYLPATVVLEGIRILPYLAIDIDIFRQAVIPVLLPLLTLAYTWWTRRAPACAVIQATPASATLPRSVTTDRTLRLLAAVSLLVALSLVPFAAYVASNLSVESRAWGQVTLGLWGRLLGQTSYLLAFGVGVAALTDAVWRRHRAWAGGLLVTLLVVGYGLILFNYIFVFGRTFGPILVDPLLVRLPDLLLQRFAYVNLLGDSFIPALLPLVVLAYSLRPFRADSAPTMAASGGPRSSGEMASVQPPTAGQVEPDV